ncbi:YkgJ family cysteine cluster protein [Pseudomonas sp.]|uniref:YkgJ family cysteine cluster protein n=1 Tax=Pseudomonas sp. TaxID=306 RepID=UPI003A970340
MKCRAGCGACCISPSISSSIPGMPNGKPAGVRCIQLDAANFCMIFGQPDRPAVCSAFSADIDVCGDTQEDAIRMLAWLEGSTAAAC